MIKDLANYFLPEQEFYLEQAVYERLDKKAEVPEYSLKCIDNIETEVFSDQVKVIVKRVVTFEPRDIFDLSVSFGAILKFNDRKEEYDWENIDLAEEFRENGDFVLANLLNRMSLLIAEITASYGQPPLILPPKVAVKKK